MKDFPRNKILVALMSVAVASCGGGGTSAQPSGATSVNPVTPPDSTASSPAPSLPPTVTVSPSPTSTPQDQSPMLSPGQVASQQSQQTSTQPSTTSPPIISTAPTPKKPTPVQPASQSPSTDSGTNTGSSSSESQAKAQAKAPEEAPPTPTPTTVAPTTPKSADTPPPQTSAPIVAVTVAPTPTPLPESTPSAEMSPGQAAQHFLNVITTPTPPDSRHTKDMPDEYNDYQVHVVYAVAKGETDRGKDVTSYFTNSIQSWNNWLRVESGGREIKFDVYHDKLDITYVQLPKTDREYSALGREKVAQIASDLSDAIGGLKSNKKYMVYFEGGRQYDSDYVTCGDTKLNSQVVVQYLLGNPPGSVCFGNRDFVTSGKDEPRYLDYIMIHELIHSEGGVSNSAPNAESNHVNDDERDVMAIRGNFDGWKLLDVNKSNYYNLKGLPAGIYNFASSKFLTPAGSIN